MFKKDLALFLLIWQIFLTEGVDQAFSGIGDFRVRSHELSQEAQLRVRSHRSVEDVFGNYKF